MNNTQSFIQRCLENPWQILGEIALLGLVAWVIYGIITFCWSVAAGLYYFLKHLREYGLSYRIPLAVGQKWTDGLDLTYEIANVFGPNADEGVGVRWQGEGVVYSRSFTKAEWEELKKKHFLSLID